MCNIPSTNTDPSYRYKMPKLLSKVEGRGNGIKTAVMNCKEVALAIKRPPAYVMKWFGCELGSKASYDEKEGEGQRAIIMGKHERDDLQVSLDKFLSHYVLCPTCGLPEVDLKISKKSEMIAGLCNACGFNGELDLATQHKMATFVCKNPMDGGSTCQTGGGKMDKAARKAAKAAKQGKKDKKGNADDDGEGDDDVSPLVSDADDEYGSSNEGTKKKKKDKKEKK